MFSKRNIIYITLLALTSASLIDAGINPQIDELRKVLELLPHARFDKFKDINRRAIEFNGKFYYYEKDGIDDRLGFFNEGLLIKITDKESWKQLKDDAREERFERFLKRNPEAYIKNGKMCVSVDSCFHDLEGLYDDGLLC